MVGQSAITHKLTVENVFAFNEFVNEIPDIILQNITANHTCHTEVNDTTAKYEVKGSLTEKCLFDWI